MFDASNINPENFEGFKLCQIAQHIMYWAVQMNLEEGFFIPNGTGEKGDYLVLKYENQGRSIQRRIVKKEDWHKHYVYIYNDSLAGSSDVATTELNSLSAESDEKGWFRFTAITAIESERQQNPPFPDEIKVHFQNTSGLIFELSYKTNSLPKMIAPLPGTFLDDPEPETISADDTGNIETDIPFETQTETHTEETANDAESKPKRKKASKKKTKRKSKTD